MITIDNISGIAFDILTKGRCGECLRRDSRNRYLVYNHILASKEFLEVIDFVEKNSIRLMFPMSDGGEVVTFELVSEQEWSKRDLAIIPLEHGPEYYDEDYFKPGPKSCFSSEYTWKVYETHTQFDAETIKKRFNPKRVLDAGCAKGFLCKALGQLDIDTKGFDISQWAIDNCEPEVKGQLVQFKADDHTPWPYADNEFDLVSSYSMLEHIKPEAVPFCLKQIYRITSKWVFIAVPVSLSRKNEPWGDSTHECFMSLSWWISEALKAGLLFNWQKTSYDVSLTEGLTEAIAQVYIAFQKDHIDLVTQRRTLEGG